MNDRERNRRFRAEQAKIRRGQTHLQRDTAKEVKRLLTLAAERIKQQLKASPSEWEAWYLPQLQRAVRQAMDEMSMEAGTLLRNGARASWENGVALIDEPIKAGGVNIAAAIPEVDTRQLMAMSAFLTDRVSDISLTVANRINSELGLVMIGSQSVGDAINKVDGLVEGGRTRAISIVRTELGRAYSMATQQRQEQAAEVLPGMKKQWRRSGKLHSRPEHDAADGQIVDVDKPFIVGGVALMFPRDPAAPIGETINCGCESLPWMESWEMSTPGRKPFTDDEMARSPFRRALQDAMDQ